MNNLAISYDSAGRRDEASALRKEAAGRGSLIPPGNTPPAPEPAPPVRDIKKLEDSLAATRIAKGPEAPDTIAAMTALAAGYGADGSGRKAIKLGEEALALARRILPAGDPRTVEAMKGLITLYKSVDLADKAAALEAEMTAPKGGK